MTTAHILPTLPFRRAGEPSPQQVQFSRVWPGLRLLSRARAWITLAIVAGGGLLSAILSEQTDDVLADLRRQLLKRIVDARGALAQAESELRLVDQAIVARGGRTTGRTDGSPSDATTARERDREPDGRFQGIPRAEILAVATTVPSPITPVRVVEAFAERGEAVNLEQIRIALNRIAKDGNLTKIGPSRFAVPGAEPAEVTPKAPETAGEEAAPTPSRRSVLGTGLSPTWRRTT